MRDWTVSRCLRHFGDWSGVDRKEECAAGEFNSKVLKLRSNIAPILGIRYFVARLPGLTNPVERLLVRFLTMINVYYGHSCISYFRLTHAR